MMQETTERAAMKRHAQEILPLSLRRERKQVENAATCVTWNIKQEIPEIPTVFPTAIA